MRSWPAWSSVLLGALMIGSGLVLLLAGGSDATRLGLFAGFMVPGAILLAAGLHALQASYDNWCDCADCMGGGCGCNHCEDCVDGECCGKCSCEDGGAEAYVHQPTP